MSMDTQFLSEDLIDHLIEHSTGDQSAKERRQKRREERRKPSSVGGGRPAAKPGRPSATDNALATVDFTEWVHSLPPEGLSRRKAADSLSEFLASRRYDISSDSIRREGGLLSGLLSKGTIGKRGDSFTRPERGGEKVGKNSPF
jgi:hypothetical protein